MRGFSVCVLINAQNLAQQSLTFVDYRCRRRLRPALYGWVR
jgi:hypothetical protein